MADKKALKILYSRFWDPSKGWQDNDISAEDFAYAKKHGVMFDETELSHDESVSICRKLQDEIDRQQVASAFAASLLTRDLASRSALSSYACILHLPAHAHTPIQDNPTNDICRVCGGFDSEEARDANVFSFERHKFGGVRHQHPTFAAFDLEQFSRLDAECASEDATDCLRHILQALREPGLKRLSQASSCIKSIVKSNGNERDGIVSALGYCGILHVPAYEDLHARFIPDDERTGSSYAKSDWPFPADLWIPEYGLNDNAINFWFGSLL